MVSGQIGQQLNLTQTIINGKVKLLQNNLGESLKEIRDKPRILANDQRNYSVIGKE